MQMGRMHSGGKGIASSSLPYKRSPPSWLKVTSTQVEDLVGKLAKKGLTPSQVFWVFFLLHIILVSKNCRLALSSVIHTASPKSRVLQETRFSEF